VAVNGPGSFTGVRVGSERGEGAGRGVADSGGGDFAAAGSLARKAGVPSWRWMRIAARCFCGWKSWGQSQGVAGRSAGAGGDRSCAVAGCGVRRGGGSAAGARRGRIRSWCGAAPVARMRLRLGEARLVAGGNVDLALLDGNYLRRSDAEIFGEAAAAGRQRVMRA
jgi:hypothetical protein